MKILIITQYFWPENFRINDLAIGLKERGNEVQVLTGKPNYPSGRFYQGYNFFNKKEEEWQGIKIHRSPLIPRGSGSGVKLMINYLSFGFFASLRTLFLKEKYDLIFVYEPSPITVGIPAVFMGKRLKIPIYFWVQDLWPESVSAAGQLSSPFVLKHLDKVTRWIYNNSKKILIQSKGFREYILNQGVPNDKIIYYPNSTESFYNIVRPNKDIEKLVPNVPFKVMFAGNIGEAQDFESIIEAAKIVKEKNPNIHFVILGNGRKKEFVIQKVNDYGLNSNFHLLGAFPVDNMPDFFACGDALLVSLKKSKIFSLTIPSKVQSYLACGKPIIGALDGEGAKVILEAKAGLVATASNPVGLAEIILELYSQSPKERQEMCINSRKYFEENFERELLLDKLIHIFNEQ